MYLSSPQIIDQPAVSVLLPVFNGEYWVRDCLKSIFSQDFNTFELIVVDDGSTDNSWGLLESLCLHDRRVRLYRRENCGLVASLNFALQEARAPWIARMDIDDLSHPHRFSTQLRHVEHNPGVVCLGSGFHLINECSEIVSTYHLPSQHSQILDRLIMSRTCFPHASAFFRRDVALQIGGYRKCMTRAQDTDLWLRFSEYGALSAIPFPLVSIRQHPQQLSAGQGAYEQFLMGWSAVISYKLRTKQLTDPLSCGAVVSHQFRDFVNEQLVGFGFFTIRSLKHDLKQSFAEHSLFAFLFWLKSFVKSILCKPFLLIYFLAESRVNNHLSDRIASQWAGKG